jgi:hypothetical protein
MVRTFAKSDNNLLTIQLPNELIGKDLEVIAFEINEGARVESTLQKKQKPSELRGFLSAESAEVINQQIEQSRNEWDTL